MTAPWRWVANLHLLFTELPLLERPAAAAAEGFDAVELWWPFDGRPRPEAHEVDALAAAIESAGVQLTAMNLYAGTMAEGDRGVVSHPEATHDFEASVQVARDVAARLGTQLFNVPYGRGRPDLDPDEQRRTAVQNLALAARVLAPIDGIVLVEPLSGFPDYPILTTDAALSVIAAVRDQGVDNIGLLLDQYHLATNGEDPIADLATCEADLVHVQVADVPDRGEPDDPRGAVAHFLHALKTTPYRGAVALEYRPRTTTAESLMRWRWAGAAS